MNGRQPGAGTSCWNAFICLVGSSGHSGKLYLTGLTSTHTEMWDNIIVESSGDLGEIQVVILGIDKSLFHYSWYVNEVGVYNFQSKNQDDFPCYHWTRSGESVSITAKTGKRCRASIIMSTNKDTDECCHEGYSTGPGYSSHSYFIKL